MEEPIKLQIDAREPNHLIASFQKMDVAHEVKMLDIGDYVYSDTVIERKTVEDFANSIRSGHMQKQLLDMQANYKNRYLIISGTHSASTKAAMGSSVNYMAGWTIEHHLGALASVAVRYDVKLIQVENDTQLVKIITKIIQKQYDGKVPTFMDTELMMIKNQIKDSDIKVRMLAALPKISVGRALTLSHNVDVRIVEAGTDIPISKDKLKDIDGIGEVLASTICSVNVKEERKE